MDTIFIRILTVTVFFTVFSSASFSQDVIYKTNNDTLYCKVKEIGTTEIKYTLPSYPQDLLFNIEKDHVRKIFFENGQEMYFEKDMTDPGNYLDNKRNALKVDFIAPLTGNFTMAYERSLKPGKSFEVNLGIIGLGTDQNDRNASGLFTKFCMKFIKSPDFYLKGMRYAHILKGSYLMPEVFLGYYRADYDEYDYYYYYPPVYRITREEVFTGGIALNLGKQWVFDNSFLVDFYFGAGYGFDSNNRGSEYHYNFVSTGDEVPLAFTAGLKIGFLFDNRK